MEVNFIYFSCLGTIEHCELADKVTQSQGKSKAPTASRLEFKEMKTYGGMPMTDEVVIVTCVHCDKPMIPSAVKEHRGNLSAYTQFYVDINHLVISRQSEIFTGSILTFVIC